jgi:hypothetical protein
MQNATSDTCSSWLHTIRNIEPLYDKIIMSADIGPTIRPSILKNQYGYRVLLEEFWHDDIKTEYYDTHGSGSCILDQRVEWVTKELEKWHNVQRTAWDMWQFKYKKDADQFILLYYLKWAK